MANRYFLPLCPQNVTCLKTEIQGIYLLKLRDTKEQFVTTSISSEEFWFLLNRVLWSSVKTKGMQQDWILLGLFLFLKIT